jgi:hypothetical protein
MNLTFRISPIDYLPDITFCEINIYLLLNTSFFFFPCATELDCLNIKHFNSYFNHVCWAHFFYVVTCRSEFP